MTVPFKICGLTDPAAVDAVADAGAQFAGFVFFPPSPRSVSLDDAAMLTARTPDRIQRVGLFVDPDDDTLTRTLAAAALDIIQLHGKETPDRVAEVRARTGRPVIKALGITDAADLDAAARFAPVVDYFMFDAKPPKDATRPGGNATAFDWTLLAGRRWSKPWFLAGGLTPENIAGAVRLTGAPMVDTSSGVEDAPGQKSRHKILLFSKALAGI